jgi:hypothetical protein
MCIDHTAQDDFTDASSDTKTEAKRAVALAVGISPIIVLLPEIMMSKKRTINRYEWRMVCDLARTHSGWG